MASFGHNGFTDQSADLNVRVRAEFLSASPSLSGSKGAAPTAEWLREDASVICARQMPDRWTVCEHILAEYEGQIPTQGCFSPAARQKPFSMRCSACGRCMENVSAIVEFEVARYFDATRRREPAITSSIWVAGQGTDRDPGPRGLHGAWTGRSSREA